MWHLVWLHVPSWSQTLQSSSRSWENTLSGFTKKQRPFRQKRAQRHKWNYDKRSRAAALEVGDVVLVHVTTFKGHHKMQNRWEIGNMWWKSSPILIYQFMWYTPGMGKGTARPCIGTICYPSIPNMGQDEADGSEERVKNNTSLTPAPSADNSLQDSPDWPAPVRCSI